ncbi:MAG TPA: four helix bundle protein [Candidatus Kapabacteria bacterium]|nr:four helix bundle protein [Candidatus Kapabacteria bacterium]
MEQNSKEDLRHRTKRYALAIMDLSTIIPNNPRGWVISKQVLRSGTSVGAQYREACRAKSNADFISKIEGSLQELDETLYWLELLQESQLIGLDKIALHMRESDELIAILTAIVKKVKSY